MILSEHAASHILRVTLVLGFLLALPLSFAASQDFEAVEKRLAKGVVKGELSLGQAAAMMEMLRDVAEDGDDKDREDFRAEMKEELEEVGAKLRKAVMRGEMSEGEAWVAWDEFKENEFAPQLKEAVREGMMSKKEAWMWWKGVEKAESAEKLKSAVMKGEMTEQEARKKWMQMQKGDWKHGKRHSHHKHHGHHKDGHHKHHGHHKHDGHHKDGHHKHDGHKHDGHKHDGDHDHKHHGKHGKKHHPRGVDTKRVDTEMVERVRGALEEADFSPEQMRMARGVIMRMAFAMKSGGDDYEMNPRMKAFLEEKAEFNDEQIALLEGIAKRVSMRMPEGGHRGPHGRGAEMRKRFEKMREKIESAVESGEMTREEADAKYREIRERMGRGERGIEKRGKENSAESGETPLEPTAGDTEPPQPTAKKPQGAEAAEGTAEKKPAEADRDEPEATEEA